MKPEDEQKKSPLKDSCPSETETNDGKAVENQTEEKVYTEEEEENIRQRLQDLGYI